MIEESLLELFHMVMEAKKTVQDLISMFIIFSPSLSKSSLIHIGILNLKMRVDMWKKYSNKLYLEKHETSAVF